MDDSDKWMVHVLDVNGKEKKKKILLKALEKMERTNGEKDPKKVIGLYCSLGKKGISVKKFGSDVLMKLNGRTLYPTKNEYLKQLNQ
jgi:hypothetical protein